MDVITEILEQHHTTVEKSSFVMQWVESIQYRQNIRVFQLIFQRHWRTLATKIPDTASSF